jgi:transposase
VKRTVKIADLVSASQIARRLGVSRAAVSNWHVRHPGFPDPIPGTAVYRWPEVERWIAKRGTRPLRIAAALQAADQLVAMLAATTVDGNELVTAIAAYRKLRE